MTLPSSRIQRNEGEKNVRILIELDDDRFDDMDEREVPGMIKEMIKHQLWEINFKDPYLSNIKISVLGQKFFKRIRKQLDNMMKVA